MLNISTNSVKDSVDENAYRSLRMVSPRRVPKLAFRIVLITALLFIGILFLPWTQTVRGKGALTSLQPELRPQAIVSTIAGRIEKWYVREGQAVKKGDTLIFISEIKDDYFDPQLLSRTQDQIAAKEKSVGSYMEKVRSLDQQADALIANQAMKIEQARNKIQQAKLKIRTDSMDLEAAKIEAIIADTQFTRTQKLFDRGLKSVLEVEQRKLKVQETLAKRTSSENKLLASRNELLNVMIELQSIETEYNEKISKTEAEKFAAMSDMYEGEAIVTKMQSQYSNYAVRRGMYYITAPQDGYITRAVRTGIGETVKEGEELLTIMPVGETLVAELFVEPFDLPLMNVGNNVRLVFDGWPAMVFSGWPGASRGTWQGKILAVDRFISENGKFRILVGPDPEGDPWPLALRVGGGAEGMVLLGNVTIGYEIWRRFNGFPPTFYTPETKEKEKAKAPKIKLK